jgi:hypothetical protein
MSIHHPHHDRRRFLRLALGFSTGALLSGCGGGGSAVSDGVAVVTVATTPTPAAAAPPTDAVSTPLNLALNLAYLGAQYYGYAARGTGLPGALTSGIGHAGAVSGARQASFSDTLTASYAAELADDKQAHVAALRTQLGALAAAQPALDLSAAPASAFSVAAQGAGIVAAGAAFDPYVSDRNFLLGAFLVENMVAAAYRTLLVQGGDDATMALVDTNLADAIYHGGLIRTLLADRAAADSSIDTALTNAAALFATLDGTNIGDQTLAGASGISANILDADGRPIPFTRATAQVLKTLYLSGSGVGGFLPAGANGVA